MKSFDQVQHRTYLERNFKWIQFHPYWDVPSLSYWCQKNIGGTSLHKKKCFNLQFCEI